jgi:hypothetical protein
MKHEEALQHALGYAAGREDASGTRTASGRWTRQKSSGFMDFADAYAQGWDDYNHERRVSMTNARDAYDQWQATSGATIFREYYH